MRASPNFFFLLACSTACRSTKPSQLTMVNYSPIGIYKIKSKTQKKKYRGALWSQILIFLSFRFYFVNPNRPIMLSHGRKAKVAPFETVVSMNYQQYTVPYSWLIMAPFKKRCLRRLHILVAHKKLVQTVPSFPFLFSINVSF